MRWSCRRFAGQKIAWAADRRALPHPSSDLTDTEWALAAPLIPPAKQGRKPRKVDAHEVLNVALYMLSTGRQWRALPKRWIVSEPLDGSAATAVSPATSIGIAALIRRTSA